VLTKSAATTASATAVAGSGRGYTIISIDINERRIDVFVLTVNNHRIFWDGRTNAPIATIFPSRITRVALV
jgi:hypothetical protein